MWSTIPLYRVAADKLRAYYDIIVSLFGDMTVALEVHRYMPRRRSGHTTAVTIGAERFYLTANQRDDGGLGEVFIHWGKHGTSGAGLVSTYAIALSVGLHHRVPLGELIRPGLGQYFMPNGRTDDPEIPKVCSAVDYIARRLAIDWLPYPDRAALGVYTLAERVRRSGLRVRIGLQVKGHLGPAGRRSSPRAPHRASR
jgi:ribonucleoside-diphosphate reductase alpha chain